MQTKEWNIPGHCIRLTRSHWNGRSTLSVDGEVIFDEGGYLADFGVGHHFEIDGQRYALKVEPGLWGYSLRLLTGDEAVRVQEFDGRIGYLKTMAYLISMAMLSLVFAVPLGFLCYYLMTFREH